MKSTLPILALLLAGCGTTARSIEAELDADMARGEVILSCKASSSGSCHALFLLAEELITAETAAGTSAEVKGIGDGARYCVDVQAPRPGRCRAQPLVPGKQLVRSSTVKS